MRLLIAPKPNICKMTPNNPVKWKSQQIKTLNAKRNWKMCLKSGLLAHKSRESVDFHILWPIKCDQKLCSKWFLTLATHFGLCILQYRQWNRIFLYASRLKRCKMKDANSWPDKIMRLQKIVWNFSLRTIKNKIWKCCKSRTKVSETECGCCSRLLSMHDLFLVLVSNQLSSGSFVFSVVLPFYCCSLRSTIFELYKISSNVNLSTELRSNQFSTDDRRANQIHFIAKIFCFNVYVSNLFLPLQTL